ncbi:hypothetical protein Pmani_008503 [Petrolisthes manimaculis]|uniref:Uncharacterized protein n=1 Tax=Petrolisthes manimaculis TaxID=1843537 RepID=A0AAE1Q5I9_9EUCA|nr:hypothetical protein Pmani_008503 [Petrolisthes manimaculis]
MLLTTPRSSANHTASLLTTHIPASLCHSSAFSDIRLGSCATLKPAINLITPITISHLITSSQHTATDMAPHNTCSSNSTTQPPQPGDYTSLHYASAPVNGFSTMSDFTSPAALPQQLPATTPHLPHPPVSGGPGIG